MTFQSVPDTAEIVVKGTLNGQNVVNTFYATKEGGYDQADIDALASHVDDWVGALWLPHMPTQYHYLTSVVRGLTSAIDLTGEDNTNSGDGGGGTMTGANNMSLAVKRRSGFTGRGARGRVFLPGVPDSGKDDDNHVTTDFSGSMETVLNGFRAAIADVDWVEVIVHRVASGVPLAEAVIFTVVEYVVVDLVIDSMRRRLPGRGS